MRKKLLAIFSMILIACTLGMFTLTSAGAATATTVTDCTHSGDFNAIIITLEHDSGKSIGYELSSAELANLSYTSSNGTNKMTNGAFMTDGTHLAIRANSPANGDIITIKAGFTLQNITIAQEVVYTCRGANTACTLGRDEVATDALNIVNVSHSAAWNAYLVQFDVATSFSAGATVDSSKIQILSSTGVSKFNNGDADNTGAFVYPGDTSGYYVAIRAKAPEAGDVIVIGAGFTWGTGALASDAIYTSQGSDMICTAGGTIPTPSTPTTLEITDVTHDSASWQCVMVTFNVDSGLSTGASFPTTYISYTDKYGTAKEFTAQVADGTHLKVMASSYESGDLLTLNAGLAWGSVTLAGTSVYTCQGTGTAFTAGGSVTDKPVDSATLSVVSAGHMSAFPAIIIEFNVHNGINDEIAEFDRTYFSYTDADGNNKLDSVNTINGKWAAINAKTYHQGDILTLKKGLVWGSLTLAEDVVFTCAGTDAALLSGKVTFTNAGNFTVTSTYLDTSTAWGAPVIHFTLDLPESARTAITQGTNHIGSVKISYFDANRNIKPTPSFVYVGNGTFIVHLATALSGGGTDGNSPSGTYNPVVGDIIVMTAGSFITAGREQYFLASNAAYQIASATTGNSLTVYTGDSNFTSVQSITVNGNSTMLKNETQTLTYTLNAGATGTATWSSNNTSVATVDANSGLVTAVGKGEVIITCTVAGVSKEFTINVYEASADGSVFIVDKQWSTYYVPMAFEPLDKTFTLLGQYTLQYYYMTNGVAGEKQNVTESMLSAIDYTVANTVTVTITDPNNSANTDTVNVKIYALKEMGQVDSIGVSDYDPNDSKSQDDFWGGHVIMSIASYSTNAYNCRHGDWDGRETTKVSQPVINALLEMSDYMYYKEKATGKVYDRMVPSSTGTLLLWLLDNNLLFMLQPEGTSMPTGYADPNRWGAITDVNNPDYNPTWAPVYQLGDEIVFKQGFPLMKCVSENGQDQMILEAYTTREHVYVVTEATYDAGHTIEYYAETTDFSVAETIEVGVKGTVALNPERLPKGSTTGTFSFSVADSSVATVSEYGNVVGVKAGGTTTITVTLSGLKDISGNAVPDIVKTVTVNVAKGITNAEGTARLYQNSTPDLSQIFVTITYTDGSTEQVALSDSRITPPSIDTSAIGSRTYRFRIAGSNTSYKLQVEIVAGTGGGGEGGGGTDPEPSKSITGATGSVTLVQGTTPDYNTIKVTVTYSDGTTEQIALTDSRITLCPNISTATVGTQQYTFKISGGASAGYKLNVTITSNGSGGGTGGGTGGPGYYDPPADSCTCTSLVGTAGLLPLALLGVGVVLIKNKMSKKNKDK